MCTILFLHRAHPRFPLVLGANRDEFYDRPSARPRRLSDAPRAAGGVDLRAGGTWMGVNEHGIAVGLTNQRTWRAPDPKARSRGEIVTRALAARTPAEIVEQLAGVDPARYNAFNLLFGNAADVYVAYARPEAPAVEIVSAPEGVHVLANDRLGAPGFPKAERARALASAMGGVEWPDLRRGLAAILADHQRAVIEAVPVPPDGSAYDREFVWRNEQICTHGDAYGTCSSSIVALREGGVAHYAYADGPPCRAPFEDYTHLVSGTG